MPTVTTLLEESQRQGSFYVPRFEVKVEGVDLPRDVLFDVSSVTYEDSVDSIDSFKMTINNWDDERREYKFIGSETEAQLQKGNRDEPRITLFEPCGKEVLLLMGYGSQLVTMLKGNFTTMQPSFVDGKADLTVTGLNVLHQLRRKQYTTTWTDKRDSEIAQDIGRRTDKGKKRFPLPIVIDQNALGNEKPIPLVTQRNQYDIDFLFQRARMRGFVVFIQEEDKATNRPRQLYFGPSQAGMVPGLRDVSFELKWGASMMEFKPKITTANQVSSVTVRGWHRTRRTAISRTVTLDDERLTVNRDLHRILNACDAREELVVDEPVFTNCEARERAIAILLDQTKQMVTGEDVKVVGLPDLRAGQVVHITNLGARLSGRYFVTKTSHTIDDNGYITTFSCRREQYQGGGTP
jgi:phage protein D